MAVSLKLPSTQEVVGKNDVRCTSKVKVEIYFLSLRPRSRSFLKLNLVNKEHNDI